jgi:DNA-binding transcriptional MerR regulator
MDAVSFKPSQVATILETSRRKVFLYCEQSLVQPALPAVGRGVVRKFSSLDILQIALILHLEQMGTPPRHLRLYLQDFTFGIENDLEQAQLLQSGDINILKKLLSYDLIIFSAEPDRDRALYRTSYLKLSDLKKSLDSPVLVIVNIKWLLQDTASKVEAWVEQNE